MTVEVENRSIATSPTSGASGASGTSGAAQATGADGRPGRLELPAEGSLRDGFLAAFADILAHACRQDVHGRPATALHEFRKSVRRARALVRFMEGFVGVDAHAELSATLRTAHRATSALRDRQVIAGVLEDEQPDPGSVSALVRELGVAMPAAGEPDVAAIADVMVRGCLSLAELPRLLAGAMPSRIRWDVVIDGLARSFRRARRRLRAVEQRGDDEAVHGLRKRIKELDYQVELLSACGGDRVRRRRKDLDHLAEDLGQLVDLFVLRDHATQLVAPGPDHARLLAAIADERETRLEQVLAHARDVLDDSPRRYARRIVRAVRRRRG